MIFFALFDEQPAPARVQPPIPAHQLSAEEVADFGHQPPRLAWVGIHEKPGEWLLNLAVLICRPLDQYAAGFYKGQNRVERASH